jgi:hypothetical protein
MLTDTLPHVKARGSNDLIGKNVVQTMTWMTPDEYEKLQLRLRLDWRDRYEAVGRGNEAEKLGREPCDPRRPSTHRGCSLGKPHSKRLSSGGRRPGTHTDAAW